MKKKNKTKPLTVNCYHGIILLTSKVNLQQYI